jgi:hypothetical protein
MNTTKDDGQAFCDALGYKSQFGAHSPGKSLLRTLDATYEQVRETLRQLPCAVEGWEDSPGSVSRSTGKRRKPAAD